MRSITMKLSLLAAMGAVSAPALAQEAKRLGLIDFRSAGDVVAISLERLDPFLREARR